VGSRWVVRPIIFSPDWPFWHGLFIWRGDSFGVAIYAAMFAA